MNAAIRTLVLAGAAASGLAVSGCMHAPLTAQAAAMPVYAAEQAHPAVTRTLGPVKAALCLWPTNETSIVGKALDDLRADAEAKGASALVDYRYAYKINSPLQRHCRRYLEAEAAAVVLGATG
jgi:hypothetical protein